MSITLARTLWTAAQVSLKAESGVASPTVHGDPGNADDDAGLIHVQPAERWTVDRLARSAGMSRSAFYNRFRELVGEPPAKYLARWRMTLAAQTLRREDISMTDVCVRVGYASVPSFTHAFRKHHGQTPAAFRSTKTRKR